MLRRLTPMMLERDLPLKRGMAAKRAKAARNTEYLEHLLTLGNPFHLVRWIQVGVGQWAGGGTWVGTWRSVLVPSPSWPNGLAPQHQRVPLFRTAQVW